MVNYFSTLPWNLQGLGNGDRLMATSKRSRKRKVTTYFTKFVGTGQFGRMWVYKKLIHKHDLNGLFERELRTKRMIKKCIEVINYDDMKPVRSRWLIPIVRTNPCKKSRIKNHCDSYRAEKAEQIPSPDGKFSYTHDELMNLYYTKGNID